MTNVLNFPARAKPAVIESPQPEAVAAMVAHSAVMQLVSTLAFYANQGQDHGVKARAVMPAVREILAVRGVDLILPT